MGFISGDRLWIWHLFFGNAGYNNDITLFEASPLHKRICAREYRRPADYFINGMRRTTLYWLVDSIYPKSPFLLLTALVQAGDDETYFVGRQEGNKKDVERAFGDSKSNFSFLKP